MKKMSTVSETDEHNKNVARSEGMSDDDGESADELKSANDRPTHNDDVDSSLDRLSLPSVSQHLAPFSVLLTVYESQLFSVKGTLILCALVLVFSEWFSEIWGTDFYFR